MRWPEGPPHLALNPLYLFFVLFCFCFLFFLFLVAKKTCFPPRKGHFCLFLNVCLCFFLAFFGFPLFNFSFSVSLLFFSFFFPSCLSFCFLFVPCFSLFFPFLSYSLLFHEQNNIKTLSCNLFFLIFFLFWGFPVLLFLSNPFFLSLFFLILSYVFCLTSMFFGKKNQS